MDSLSANGAHWGRKSVSLAVIVGVHEILKLLALSGQGWRTAAMSQICHVRAEKW